MRPVRFFSYYLIISFVVVFFFFWINSVFFKQGDDINTNKALLSAPFKSKKTLARSSDVRFPLFKNYYEKPKNNASDNFADFLKINAGQILGMSNDDIVSLMNSFDEDRRLIFQQFISYHLGAGTTGGLMRLESIIKLSVSTPPIYPLTTQYVDTFLQMNPGDYENLFSFISLIKNKNDQTSTYASFFRSLASFNPTAVTEIYRNLDFAKSNPEAIRILVDIHAEIISKSKSIEKLIVEDIEVPSEYAGIFDKSLIINLESNPKVAVDYLLFLQNNYPEGRFVDAALYYAETASRREPIQFIEWIDGATLSKKSKDALYSRVIMFNAHDNYDKLHDYFTRRNDVNWLRDLEMYK